MQRRGTVYVMMLYLLLMTCCEETRVRNLNAFETEGFKHFANQLMVWHLSTLAVSVCRGALSSPSASVNSVDYRQRIAGLCPAAVTCYAAAAPVPCRNNHPIRSNHSPRAAASPTRHGAAGPPGRPRPQALVAPAEPDQKPRRTGPQRRVGWCKRCRRLSANCGGEQGDGRGHCTTGNRSALVLVEGRGPGSTCKYLLK